MGDVLHAMPAVAALRERHPDWFIGWAIEPRWLPLLQADSDVSWPIEREPAMPMVDRTYLASTREWKRRPFSFETMQEISMLRSVLRGEQFDVCVDMQGSIRSAVIGRMAGAQSFIGAAEPREAPARWLYGKQVKLSATHVIEQGCELLGAAVGETLWPAKVTLPVEPCNGAMVRWATGRERRTICSGRTDGGLGSKAVAVGAVRCSSDEIGSRGGSERW